MITPEQFGDAALVLRVSGDGGRKTTLAVRALAAAIVRDPPAGTIDVVSAIDRVTVIYDIGAIGDVAAYATRLQAIAETAGAAAAPETVHEIPVQYGAAEGPDLAEVCASHGSSAERFVALHTAGDYFVQAIGFVPGFAYLGGLAAELATPRRGTPRPTVPAGSVGIGGGQTGVYPCACPGGWNLVGRTRVRLFDADRNPPSLLAVGDRVRFTAVTDAAVSVADEPAPCRQSRGCDSHAWVTVVRPGLWTTIQDLGRQGRRAAGVPAAGAADSIALRLANLIVGNPEGAAAIECTLLGPDLRFDHDAVVALAGAEFPGLPSLQPIAVAAGSVLSFGHASRGCRGYLAVAGGVRVRPDLGSASTYPPAGLGGIDGRPLAAGDRVPITARGSAVPPLLSMAQPLTELPERPCTLRIIPAQEPPATEAVPWDREWRVSARSDRMGLRLEGEPLPGGRADLPSVAVLPGTVQLPPDGRPILLLADAQTIGGYQILGHVIAADLSRAGQLRPGDVVQWRRVTIAEAHRASHDQERLLASLRHEATAAARRLRTGTIDINCDMGEGAGHDAELMPLISSANIACGGHAGDPDTMRATVDLARQHGVAIGAHPGYPDREHFGRRDLGLGTTATVEAILRQIDALAHIAGPLLHHVKLHGAIYHRVGVDRELADALARGLTTHHPELVVCAAAGSAFLDRCRRLGLAVIEEAFVDRGYADDGSLAPRSTPGAVIGDPATSAGQARSLAVEGCVRSLGGRTLPIHADTLCLHGDGPDPVATATAVRQALERAGLRVAAP